MKSTQQQPHTPQKPPRAKWVSVERWTVERLDPFAKMARLESVPMKSEHLTDKRFAKLMKKGLEASMDKLSLWDIKQARIIKLTTGRLVKKISARPGDLDTLSENMVFWAIFAADKKEPEIVLHATRAARKTSKDLYRKVTGRK